jgi:Tfp pilus assembly protein PilF
LPEPLWNQFFHPVPPSEWPEPVPLIEAVLGIPARLGFYLGKALVPIQLNFVYGKEVLGWISVATLAAMTVAVLLFRRRNRQLAYAFATYVILLLPVLGLARIYFMRYAPVADHWQYPALVAFAGGLAIAAKNLKSPVPWIAAAALLSVLSFQRASAFRDEKTLWKDTLAKNPSAWLAHSNLGVLLAREGALAEAKSYFSRSLEIHPSSEAYFNLGLIAARENHHSEAASYYEKALSHAPGNSAQIRNSYGIALIQLGRTEEARAQLEQSLEARPSAETAFNLGQLLLSQGKKQEAQARFEQALSLNPLEAQLRQAIEKALAE